MKAGNDRKWWTAAIVTAGNALVSAGFAVAGLLTTTTQAAAHLFALYAAARSLPLAVAALLFVARRASTELRAMALILVLVQTSDALVGLAGHDAGKTAGPAVLAVLTLLTRRWLPLPSAARTPA